MSAGGFHDVSFPMRLAFGASGGPERRTQVVTLASGREVRNGVWAGSRRRWDVAGAVTRMEEAAELVAFFEARGGRLYGFRFRDMLDDRSCAQGRMPEADDQEIGIGDGVRTRFALRKAYGEGWRAITRPVAGSVTLALDGVVQETGWSVSTSSGEVEFAAAPGVGVRVTAGFVFDVPVRFEADRIETRVEDYGAASIAPLGLVELV